jgi:hypothetical protein
MLVRKGAIILVSLTLYAVGLYGIWKALDGKGWDWTTLAFPCGVALIATVPMLGKAPAPAAAGGFPEPEEDRSE